MNEYDSMDYVVLDCAVCGGTGSVELWVQVDHRGGMWASDECLDCLGTGLRAEYDVLGEVAAWDQDRRWAA